MSTSPKKTAAVAVKWSAASGRIVEVHNPLKAPAIANLIASTAPTTWAVDVPFGWPDQFVALLANRHQRPLTADLVPDVAGWEKWRTRQVAQRLTDRFLTDDPRIRTRPLPASFQLLGATAAAWTLIESQLAAAGVPVDRAGVAGRVCETYPSAVLAAWGAPKGTGKHTWPALRNRFPFLTCDPELEHLLVSDDVCDAVVCAMAARARDLGLTVDPDDDQLDAARREGWIHVSLHAAGRLLDVDGEPPARP
ncbi:DUF429 domain-containing protein [Nocardioides salarius]|uniref:DUF429 domain-containing protein n=1 Tax=Nocardioides salarius TaxID=374513 RepID=UPI0030F7E8CF